MCMRVFHRAYVSGLHVVMAVLDPRFMYWLAACMSTDGVPYK